MPTPSALSLSSTRRRLAPITESPPDSPTASRTSVLPIRLSFLSLHRSRHRRPRTTSSDSSSSTTEVQSTPSYSPDRPRVNTATTRRSSTASLPEVDERHGQESLGAPAPPRNSGTFGRLDPDSSPRTPEAVNNSPSHTRTPSEEQPSASHVSSPMTLSPIVHSTSDDDPHRLSGTFGPQHVKPALKVTTSPASTSPASSTSSLPVAGSREGDSCHGTPSRTNLLSPDDHSSPVRPLRVQHSLTDSSIFYTPLGSSLSLELGDKSRTSNFPEDQAVTSEEARLSLVKSASSRGDGTHKTGSAGSAEENSEADNSYERDEEDGRREVIEDESTLETSSTVLSRKLVASHTHLLALAEELSVETDTLVRSTNRLQSIRRSLDVEIEGLMGLTSLLHTSDESVTEKDLKVRRQRHSAGPERTGRRQNLSPSLLESLRNSVEELESSKSSRNPPSPPKANNEVKPRFKELLESTPTIATAPSARPQHLGVSAEATGLSSGVSLPIRPLGALRPASSPPDLGKRRKSWIKRIFA